MRATARTKVSKSTFKARDASSTVLTIQSLPNKRLLVQTYAESLKIVWAVTCVLSGVTMLGSIFVRKVNPNRALHSEQALRMKSSETGQDHRT